MGRGGLLRQGVLLLLHEGVSVAEEADAQRVAVDRADHLLALGERRGGFLLHADLRALRGYAVNEVKRTYGRISFDSAVKIQNSPDS